MSNFALWGTVVNTLAIICGGLLGCLIKKLMGAGASESRRVHELSELIFKGLALCVLMIGIIGVIKTQNALTVIISIVIGGVIGGLIDIDRFITKVGYKLEKTAKSREGSVAQGFINGSLLFCVGAMAVIGSMNSGLLGDHTMLYSKSMIDMASAIVMALTMGIGVVYSAASVFAVQSVITLVAYFAGNALAETVLTGDVITEMTAVGSILIMGIAFNMLGLTKIKVSNLIPAIFLPIGLVPLFNLIF